LVDQDEQALLGALTERRLGRALCADRFRGVDVGEPDLHPAVEDRVTVDDAVL
jgi:hypothetical protein